MAAIVTFTTDSVNFKCILGFGNSSIVSCKPTIHMIFTGNTSFSPSCTTPENVGVACVKPCS